MSVFRLYRGNVKGLFFYLNYLLFNRLYEGGWIIRTLSYPFRLLYRLIINWVMCIDILESTKIGKNLLLWHGFGVAIHPSTVIGDNCIIHQNVTIGNAHTGGGAPSIGNNVVIGAGAIIIGPISIGNNVVIGAGTVVTKSVPSNCTVIGNPAKIREHEKK